MKCPSCKKKMGIVSITCKYCKHNYCTTCINLEKHSCPAAAEARVESREQLALILNSCIVTKKEKLLLSP